MVQINTPSGNPSFPYEANRGGGYNGGGHPTTCRLFSPRADTLGLMIKCATVWSSLCLSWVFNGPNVYSRKGQKARPRGLMIQ